MMLSGICCCRRLQHSTLGLYSFIPLGRHLVKIVFHYLMAPSWLDTSSFNLVKGHEWVMFNAIWTATFLTDFFFTLLDLFFCNNSAVALYSLYQVINWSVIIEHTLQQLQHSKVATAGWTSIIRSISAVNFGFVVSHFSIWESCMHLVYSLWIVKLFVTNVITPFKTVGTLTWLVGW